MNQGEQTSYVIGTEQMHKKSQLNALMQRDIENIFNVKLSNFHCLKGKVSEKKIRWEICLEMQDQDHQKGNIEKKNLYGITHYDNVTLFVGDQWKANCK